MRPIKKSRQSCLSSNTSSRVAARLLALRSPTEIPSEAEGLTRTITPEQLGGLTSGHELPQLMPHRPGGCREWGWETGKHPPWDRNHGDTCRSSPTTLAPAQALLCGSNLRGNSSTQGFTWAFTQFWTDLLLLGFIPGLKLVEFDVSIINTVYAVSLTLKSIKKYPHTCCTRICPVLAGVKAIICLLELCSKSQRRSKWAQPEESVFSSLSSLPTLTASHCHGEKENSENRSALSPESSGRPFSLHPYERQFSHHQVYFQNKHFLLLWADIF